MSKNERDHWCRCREAVLTGLLVVTSAVAGVAHAQTPAYTLTNLGKPTDADSVLGVRMNNLGHVAGYSLYYGSEPSIRPWVWTAEDGFTVLPPPPDMYLGRARAMDISDTGIVAGDGGFDAGIAWRWESGEYETFGQVEGLPIAYLGGINNAGDVAGTAKDAMLSTPDEAFLAINDGETIVVTSEGGGRATDVNNNGQVCGYSQGPLSGFEAFRWHEVTGIQFLGTAGLAYSFASQVNDLGQVVGSAQSATGHTTAAWIYSDEQGQQVIPAPVGDFVGAVAINNLGQVVGITSPGSGPDFGWLWTPLTGARTVYELHDMSGAGFTAVVFRDINDAGQILAYGYDNTVGEFRTVLLTPLDTAEGACCLDGGDCAAGVTADECTTVGGVYLGGGTDCAACTPVGACCLTDGDCEEFLREDECTALAGLFQGADTSCATAACEPFLPNDDCADAIPIALGDTPFSTLGATTDGPDLPPSCIGFSPLLGMDIWYTYQPDGSGTLTVSTCNQADFDTQIAAYTGTCDSLEIVACNDDVPPPTCYYGTSIMEVPVTCGEPILIRVGSFSVYTGTGILTLSFEGDPCGDARGDLDGDGDLDLGDYAMLARCVGGPAAASDPGCAGADLDGDGDVDLVDVSEFTKRLAGTP